jgi:hypothetical protein
MVEEWVEELLEVLMDLEDAIKEIKELLKRIDDRIGLLENIAVVMMVRDTDRAIEEEEKVEGHG